MHYLTGKNSSPCYQSGSRNTGSEAEGYELQGMQQKLELRSPESFLVLCSTFFGRNFFLMSTLDLMTGRDLYSYCKEYQSKEFYSILFSFGKPNMLYFIFHNLFKHLNIQNRYNLFFFACPRNKTSLEL